MLVSLFQLVVSGAQISKSGLKPLNESNSMTRDVEIAAQEDEITCLIHASR